MHGEEPKLHDWQAEGDFARPLPRPADDWGFDGADFEPPQVELETAEEPAATDVSTVSTEPTEPQPWRLRWPAAAWGAAILAAGTFLAVGAIDKGGRSRHHASLPVHCGTPSPQAMNAVRHLFGSPNNGFGRDIQATANGLHMANNGYGFETQAPPTDPQEVQTDINRVNQELQPFGITVSEGTLQNDGYMGDLHNPSEAELNNNLASSLNAITNTLADVPVEMVRMSGIKNIVLMSNPKSNTKTSFYNSQTVAWNIDLPSGLADTSTALYVGMDLSQCGYNSETDASYAAINGRNIYGAASNHTGLSSLSQFGGNYAFYDGAVQDYLKANDQDVANANLVGQQTGNWQQYCYLLKGAFAQIVVASPDGFSSVEDDKRQLGGFMIEPGNESEYDTLLSSGSPTLKAKTQFLLGRMYQKNPQVVKYLAAISDRPSAAVDPRCE